MTACSFIDVCIHVVGVLSTESGVQRASDCEDVHG